MQGSWQGRMAHYRSPEAAERYRRKYRRSVTRWLGSRRELALVQRMCARLEGLDSVLDCPCGAGRLLPLLGRMARAVVAVDLSWSMLAIAKESAAGPVRLVQGAAQAIPLARRSVDAVVCHRLLHHFPAPAGRVEILTEAARVARRAVIVTFADAGTWKARRAEVSRRKPLLVAQLRNECESAGLELEPPVLRVGGLFSTQAVAFLRVLAADQAAARGFARAEARPEARRPAGKRQTRRPI